MMMSRLKLEGVWSTNRLASSATGVASSNQVLIVVAVISPSMRESTLGQISAGKFTERPPLSENINSTLLYQKIALKQRILLKKESLFLKISPPGRDRRCFPVTCLGLGAAAPEPHGAGRRYVVRWRQDLKAVAARIGRRVSMLCLTAPADYPPNLAACALYLPGQRHPGLRCAGLAAVPVPRSAGNAAGSARPVFYLYGPLCAYPPRFSVLCPGRCGDATLLTPPRKTLAPAAQTAFSSAGCAVRLLRPPPRFCVGAALVAARPKPGTGRKEAGGDKSRPYG